jgi:transposase
MEGLERMMTVPAPRKYPQELRDRAMRLVHEAREQQDPELSLNAVVVRIGQRTGANPNTLRGLCKQGDIDTGRRPGSTTEDFQADQ